MTKARELADLLTTAGGIGTTELADDAVTAAKLDDSASFTVSGLTVDGTANITNTASTNTLTLTGNTGSVAGLRLAAEENHAVILGVNEGNNFGGVKVQTNSNGTLIDRVNIASNGDITMFKDDGSTAGLTFDASSGNVGIGTAPGRALHVKSSNATVMQVESTNASIAQMTFVSDGAASNPAIGAIDDTAFNIQTGNVERLRIQSDGSVQFKPDGTNVDMTLDASGNLLVAKTSADGGVAGFEARSTGETFATSSGATLYAKRTTGDGDIIVIQGSSGTVGSIGTDGGSLVVGGGDVGIGFYQGANALVPYNSDTNAVRDAEISLGYPSIYRWKDLYLSGTIIGGPRISMNNENGGIFFGTTGTNGGGGFGDNGAIARAASAGYHTGGSQVGDMVIAAERQKDLLFGTSSSSSGGVTTRMKIDQAGRVTMPSQPCFEVYNGGSDFAVSGNAKITCFSSERFDVGGVYNTSNQRFTAPVSGKYLFGMHLRMGAPGSVRVFRVEVRINGSANTDLASIGGTNNYDSGGGYDHPGCSGTTLLNLSANDYIELYTANELDSTNTLYIQNGFRSHWWGMLVS